MRLILALILAASGLLAQSNKQQIMIATGEDAPTTPTDSNTGGGCTGSSGAWTCTGAPTVTVVCPATAQFCLYNTSGSVACPATGTVYSSPFTGPGTTFTLTAIGCNGITGGGVLTSVYTISGGISVLDHKSARGTGATSTATTAAMACSGGNFVVAWVPSYAAAVGASSVTTTNPTATLTRLFVGAGANTYGSFFYGYNLTLTNSTTVAVSVNSSFPSISGLCASGVRSGSDPIDVYNSTTPTNCTSGTTCNFGGSLTPTVTTDICFAGLVTVSTTGTPFSINSGFVTPPPEGYNLSGGNAQGGAVSYLVPSGTSALTPQFTTSATYSDALVLSACFKAP